VEDALTRVVHQHSNNNTVANLTASDGCQERFVKDALTCVVHQHSNNNTVANLTASDGCQTHLVKDALTGVEYQRTINNDLTVALTTILNNEQMLLDQDALNNGHYRRTLSAFNDLREISGAALYISLACRPDIMFAAHQLTLVASKPQDEHWRAACELLQYLKVTADRELVYHRDPSYSLNTLADDYHPRIVAYCDSDYGTDRATRRSITGYLILLDDKPVHWCSRRQPIVAVSSTEAEYIALAECTKEVLWMRHLIEQLTGHPLKFTPIIHVDNQAAIHCAHNGIQNTHIKHLSIRYYFVKECVDSNLLNIHKIDTSINLADGFTKPLMQPRHNKLFNQIMTPILLT